MSEWSTETKATLRKVLRITDLAEISKTLQIYSERYELFDAYFPTWPVQKKVDWCCSCALAPNWFGDMLSTRINNTMLVSALLITVTTAILFFPPQYGMVDDYHGEQSDTGVNVFLWLTSMCNMLFIVSIISGIGFVENAMSRSYTDDDKMILVARFYFVLNISQWTSNIGSFLFVTVILSPLTKIYEVTQATMVIVVTAIVIGSVAIIYFYLISEASASQGVSMKQFARLVDSKTGRIKPEFYPPDAEMSLVEYKAMFALDGVAHASTSHSSDSVHPAEA